MSHGVPADFARVVAAARLGEKPRVAVRDLLRWFGFERRGARVNDYIHGVMAQEGVSCEPKLEVPWPDGELVFASAVRVVVVVGPPPSVVLPASLPHPIAVFEPILAAQAQLTGRVRTRLDAIERATAYLVFAELAAVRAASDGAYPAAVVDALRDALPQDDRPGPPLSFGVWVRCARELAPLVPADAKAVRDAAVAFGRLGVRIADEIVPMRNRHAHGSTPPETWYRDVEPTLEAVDGELRRALAPLFACELFCVRGTEPGEHEAYRYDVRVLHGSAPFFPRRAFESSAKLGRRWAYLDVAGCAPLRLAPGIACVEDGANERVRLYVARTLALDAGRVVSLRAVLDDADLKEQLPA